VHPRLWTHAAEYEAHIGRWSRIAARQFVAWLSVRPGSRWLDAGCGTGALTQAIVDLAMPVSVTGVDASAPFIELARERVFDERASFVVGDACALSMRTRSYEAAVAGLLLQSVGDPSVAVAELARVLGPGDVAGAYVWDFAGEMQLLRRFWDAAIAIDPAAALHDVGARYAMCRPEVLLALFQGAAQYMASLTPAAQGTIRDRVRASIPSSEAPFELVARAWAVRGVR
jgi:SAM-dependent methyltransferase